MTNCIGYLRVSTERQAGEQLTSLSDQESAIKNLAQKLNLEVSKWFRDEGASGATVEGRPAFSDMLKYCETHKRSPKNPSYVLVLNDSRFGRFPDPDEAAALRFRFKQAGWTVRFAEGDESEDVMVRSLMRSVGSAQASEYRTNLMRNSRRGMKGSANQGFWTRRSPFGYRRKVVYPPGAERVLEGSTRKAPTEKVALVVHEEEAAVVRWMFEGYAQGTASLFSIGTKLREMYPGKRWTPAVVGQMLRNIAYVGDVLGGRRPNKDELKAVSIRPEAEWYGKKNAHEAIVSREVFLQVRSRFEHNKAVGKAVSSPYLLTGLVTCLQCGKPYVGGGGGKKEHPKIKLRRMYRCSGGVGHDKVCPGVTSTVTRHILDDAVLGAVSAAVASPQVKEALEYWIEGTLKDLSSHNDDLGPKLDAQEKQTIAKRDRIAQAIANGTLTNEEAAPAMQTVRAELQRIEDERQALKFNARWADTLAQEKEKILKTTDNFPELCRRLPEAEARELIRPWLQSATFDKVTRELNLTIRRVPQMSYIQPAYSQERVSQMEGAEVLAPITRAVNLTNAANYYRKEQVQASIDADLARKAGGV